MIEYNGQLKDYNYNIYYKRNHHKGCKDTIQSLDKLCLDFETSSCFINKYDNSIYIYQKGCNTKWLSDNYIPIGFVYIWQLSINGIVYYGRTLEELSILLHDIPVNIDVIIWVHNLSFEFQFLRNIINFDNVFASKPRKPIYCKSSIDFPNIEFRCSYMLTHLSLEKWADKIGKKKLIGQLDYSIFRTPFSQLNEKELEYCEEDVLIMDKGLDEYIDIYGSVWDIPLTQTGCIRRKVKELLMSDDDYCKFIKKLVPQDADFYKILMQTYWGAWVHANRLWSGQLIDSSVTDIIGHKDFASSYPYCLISEKYPMSRWIYKGKLDESKLNTLDYENNAYIFLLEFSELKSKTLNTYISESKCIDIKRNSKQPLDNGRVINADYLSIYCTEQDFLIISDMYSWDKLNITRVYESKKEYLPKPLIEFILDLFEKKTTLDGIDDKLYLKSKEEINSIYGMMVTAIVHATVNFCNDDLNPWTIQKPNKDKINTELDKLRDYKNSKKYFLSYSWGIWCTAYARRNLMSIIVKNDDKVLYGDTDGIFSLGQLNTYWYDKIVDIKLEKICKHYNIDINKTCPKKPNGTVKHLGYFEDELDCLEFKTLGSKRYVERKLNGELKLTVSGINKDAVELLNNDINNFKDGLVFDKDSDCVKKLLITYNDNQPNITFNDGFCMHYKYGVNIRPNGYKLSLNDDYKNLLELDTLEWSNITDSGYNNITSLFW